MNHFIDNTYWIAVAHLPRWTIERINRFIIHVIHEKKLSWSAFFALDNNTWKEFSFFTDKELADLETTKTDLPRLAFLAEQLHSEGFHVIPINSADYPAVLKENLKIGGAPPVVYLKGWKELLREEPVAIVGSRKAGATALEFTDRVAKKMAAEAKVVVSGFAKGVDKQALDSTLEANGKSIIVLPQGILTFQSGLKKYYQPIVNGQVLVLSTFFPKAGWEVGLAMARNTYIYGLAKEIYVAETDSSGGTWEGAMNGLKRQRKIYVRYPDAKEKNANVKLIELGAFPVGMNGEILEVSAQASEVEVIQTIESNYQTEIEKNILALLSKGSYTTREILLALKLDWESRKLTSYLKNNPNIKVISEKPIKYTRNDVTLPSLF